MDLAGAEDGQEDRDKFIFIGATQERFIWWLKNGMSTARLARRFGVTIRTANNWVVKGGFRHKALFNTVENLEDKINIMERKDLEGIAIHVMRSTFATTFLDNGNDLKTV